MNEEKIIRAGKILEEVRNWIKPQIKKGIPILELAEMIEDKIQELGGGIAFPTGLSIDEQAAHYTPSYDDETLAHGLMKVDFGVEVDGWIADSSFSVDLENSSLNKEVINASYEALKKAGEIISSETRIKDVGKTIEKTIRDRGFNPIANLSGHSMEQYDLHAGTSVPNVNTNSEKTFDTGLYAVEPFATNGRGFVHDGNKGNIMILNNDSKNTRSPLGREILEFIKDNYGSLPFASRWIIKEFGRRALISLNQLENEGILYHYPILTEEKGKVVSQSENTFLVKKDKVINTTKA